MNVEKDQHFLNNKNILSDIISSSEISINDIILEIGAGNGILTKKILKQNPKKLISVEVDDNFESDLYGIKKEYDNFDFIIDNALNYLKKLKFNKIIANIPYSITENLYSQILDLRVKFCVLTHGRRFFNIINDKKCKWYYFVSAFYNVELIKEVKGNEFIPETKINSVVLKLNLKEKLSDFDFFIQNFYFKKDRSVYNAIVFSLVDTFNISKGKCKFEYKLNISEEILSKKVKNLSNKEFLEVINLLLSYNIF